MLVGHSNSSSFPRDLPIVSHGDAGLEIILSDLVVHNISKRFSLVLVGRFLTYRPTIEMVRKWVSTRWKLKGTVEVVVGVLFLFKFINDENRNHVLARTWRYNKHNLVLAKWKLGFIPSVDLQRMTSI